MTKYVTSIGSLLGLAFLSGAVATGGEETGLQPNEINPTHPCPGGEIPLCVWPMLATVPSSLDRLIWDGSFTQSSSGPLGPGGRWIGQAGQSTWGDPPWRRVETEPEVGGHLVMSQTFGTKTCSVYGQTFGAAADVSEVLIGSCDSISLRFRAKTIDQDCEERFWVRLQMIDCAVDGDPVWIDADTIQGDWDTWFVVDSGGSWIDCRLDLGIGPDVGSINIVHWAPIVTFGMRGNAESDSTTIQIDDIEVDLASHPTQIENILSAQDADDCQSWGSGSEVWWSLMTDLHYLGGGEDRTSPLSTATIYGTADVNQDCQVNVLDLLEVIGDWTNDTGSGDANCDGESNVLDLLLVIGDWGWTCP